MSEHESYNVVIAFLKHYESSTENPNEALIAFMKHYASLTDEDKYCVHQFFEHNTLGNIIVLHSLWKVDIPLIEWLFFARDDFTYVKISDF